jgi:mono/diheme cytochrome c family protein
MRPACSTGRGLVPAAVLVITSFLTWSNAGAQAAGPVDSATSYFNEYHSVPRDTVTPTVYQGWKQYALNCARCHGDFGVGTTFAPALVESVKPNGTIPSPELFLSTVCAGRPDKGMPGWCAIGLDMQAMQVIYAYLVERSGGKVGLGRPAVLGQ